MEPISAIEIARATRGQINHGRGEKCFAGVSTDSRHISDGDLFVPLKGEYFNGHDFVLDAIARGASGAVVSHESFSSVPPPNSDVVLIAVNDTLKALGDLAAHYRRKLPTHIVAVTGSNGKTTTKCMIHHLLNPYARVTKSPKSFNNCIGVPLTIFELNRQTDFGIIELGTNAPGEIRRLSEIVRPHTAVLTNISETHLECLGSIEGVAREKGQLLDYVSKDGTAVINADNAWSNEIAITGKFPGRFVTFGMNNEAQIRGSNIIRTDFGLAFTLNGDIRVDVPFYGIHNVYNCLAALAVCHSLGFDIEDLSRNLLSFRLPEMRMDRQNVGDMAIINDAYNANPQSMIAALNEYGEMEVDGRKILICGDMLELGTHAERLHREIGARVAHTGVDLLLTVGRLSRHVAESACAHGMAKENVMCFDRLDEIIASIVNCLKEGDTILIKGSRQMGLDVILERVKFHFSRNSRFEQSGPHHRWSDLID